MKLYVLGKQLSDIKYPRAISRVNWLSDDETNVSRTISVLVFRVMKYRDGPRNVGFFVV
jgi:hypothetical protein